ncbi:MAG: DUF11 domain-containing protein [Phycisphaeraceae bacterium]|nr:DUF11 domain-containing protein [Phycisphaeraceae bacterium]
MQVRHLLAALGRIGITTVLLLILLSAAVQAQTPASGNASASAPGSTPATGSAPGNAPKPQGDGNTPGNAGNAGNAGNPGSPGSPDAVAVGRRVWPQGAATGTLIVEKHAPAEVRPNQAYTYKLVVINPTGEPMRNVVLAESNPDVVRVVSANPEARAAGKGVMQWALGDIPPGSAREVFVNATVSAKAQQIVSCVTVTHDVVGCWSINVTEPKVQLAQVMPGEALMCDEIPVQITLSNTGTGVARNVRAVTQLPQGLTTGENQSAVSYDIGNIPAGQAKQYVIKCRAVQPGDYTVVTQVASESGNPEKAQSRVKVDQPQLAIVKEGPNERIIGRAINYNITVTNKGSVDAREVVIRDQVPTEVRLLGASDDGKFSQATNEVVWNLGTLPAKQTRKIAVSLAADKPGELTNVATASAYCVPPVTAIAHTKVTGISAILLEVIDVDDPVEVGANVVYIITVTNQGSATGTNIRIECNLENTMQYISSEGATAATATPGKIVFDPLPALGAKAKASWKIVVKALSPGDVRFSVKMESDQINRSVIETEATNFYQ